MVMSIIGTAILHSSELISAIHLAYSCEQSQDSNIHTISVIRTLVKFSKPQTGRENHTV